MEPRIWRWATESVGAKFVFISTDYVFDGKLSHAYREDDTTNPQSIYGKSKRSGELHVQAILTQYFIVRTSWVYGVYGKNFVKTMLELAKTRDSLKVVSDQYGSPTYTVDLALFLESSFKPIVTVFIMLLIREFAPSMNLLGPFLKKVASR